MNINDIKFDHFKNIEELIQHLEMWYAEDDYYAYNRFFGLRDARIMGMIIYQLTNNWNELEEFIKDMLFTTPHENQMLDFILDKMKEKKDGNK